MRLLLLSALAALLVSPAAAKTKRTAPWRKPAPAPTSGGPCDLTIPGVWTGFIGNNPLSDAYELAWRGGLYPQGSFTAVYISGGPSWSLGVGQFSADNTTVTIELDNSPTDVLNGTVSDGCSTISWDNGSSWRKTVDLPKRVHMIEMNHLDVGYNGIPTVGLVNNILNIYFGEYYPRALAMAEAMKLRGGPERFIYTTHPWLLDLYLNCPTNFTLANVTLVCPSAADVDAMKTALQNGDVSMHAAPFNIQYGGAHSQDILDLIFAEPKRVADLVGIPHPVVASLRDVPGAPRSIVPGLVRNNISVLSIGVNDYAPRPQIPTPCVWTEPETNTSVVLVMTQQGQGYPDNVGPDPLHAGGLDASYCVSHPASPAVLCWAFRTDNSGPPESVEEILGHYEIARWQWPGAEVLVSTFDAWWAEFQSAVPQLPVSTSEMGETWLTGFASDPPKNAFFRAASREYSACLAAGQCSQSDPRIQGFSRMIMKMPEHTWGLPSIYDDANYTNAQFHGALAAGVETYVNSIASWQEQRDFGRVYALDALADHPLRSSIEAAVAQTVPSVPTPNGYTPVSSPGTTTFTVTLPGGGSTSLALDGATGALASLVVKGATLADPAHPMAVLEYQTLNDTTVNAQHITTQPDGHSCCCCYGWGSMQKVANPMESRTPATLLSAWASQPGTALTAPASFLVAVSFPAELNTYYGAPSVSYLNYTVNADGSVAVDVQLFNKTSTRLGEAIFLRFATPAAADSAWVGEVLGHWVDPLDVVVRGSVHQHGIGDSVLYVSSQTGAGVAVDTVDAPVWSPWTPTSDAVTYIVPYDPLTGPVEGFAAVLFANFYNTNFALFSMESAYRFRFAIRALAPSEESAARLRKVLKA